MKKSLLALAVLGAFAGVASAQSSVTLFGTVDLSAKYVKNDGSARRLSLSQDGINSSQLGFKGTEDLGGGLKAGFLLLAGVNADTGTTNGKFFNRSAYARLWGNFGEVRLGRDYVPTFWNDTIFDAFGTNGLGDSSHVMQLLTPSAASATGNFVRADNSIGYFLPSNIGGIYGQAMVAASEGGSNQGRYIGGRIGFAAGPFDIAFAAAQQRLDAGALGAPVGSNQKTYNLGGSYDLGVVKFLGYVDRDTRDRLKETRGSISAVVPIGQGEVHAGFDISRLTNNLAAAETKNTIKAFKVGYVYNLSKRTAVYTTAAYLKNGGNPLATGLGENSVQGINGVLAGSSQTAAPVGADAKSKGIEFGLRHFF
jgi:predicted porin